ncbi:MAG: hypothetical protein M1453_00230 [Acidobacteria bacterium]|nr:hypothetical protein [Acidobacteriota bacterium]MCL5286415.1 hypothetical protein [Acidobacteriota bacterium]
MPSATANVPPIGWIRLLVAPYLRGFRARVQSAKADGSLRGYCFEARGTRGERRGFFVGYLIAEAEFECLKPQPPECLVFAYVAPLGGALHRRLVRAPESLLRKTFAYIRWLTHRLPRFAFFEEQLPALVRHRSMRDWPAEKYEHLSRNFFIETCAWLVRSGLVRRLKEAAPLRKKPSRRPR